jgi:hypothetical protein
MPVSHDGNKWESQLGDWEADCWPRSLGAIYRNGTNLAIAIELQGFLPGDGFTQGLL